MALSRREREGADGRRSPVVSEDEFRTELEPLFKILEVREFRFTLDREDFRPLGWSILMERR